MDFSRLRVRRYFNCDLLIFDKVGFRPLDRVEANLSFRLVSMRYECDSMPLTSNIHVRDGWRSWRATRSSLPRSSTTCCITWRLLTSTVRATGFRNSALKRTHCDHSYAASF